MYEVIFLNTVGIYFKRPTVESLEILYCAVVYYIVELRKITSYVNFGTAFSLKIQTYALFKLICLLFAIF